MRAVDTKPISFVLSLSKGFFSCGARRAEGFDRLSPNGFPFTDTPPALRP
jgi:hypothetical protein